MFNKIYKLMIMFLLVFDNTILLSQSTLSKSNDPNIKTKTIAIFKNGYGFFIKEGTIHCNNNLGFINYIPNAALGTFWINTPDKNQHIEEAVAFKKEIIKDTSAANLEDLLRANINKKVIVTQNEKTIEGTIKFVSEKSAEYYKIVIIDTKENNVALNIGSISKIDFPKDIKTTIQFKETSKQIKVKFSDAQSDVRINLSYLQNGISWIPGYLINIEDPKKAKIRMNATLINDIENIENVNVFFVVGYPSFLFSNILSPLTLEESVSRFLSSLSSNQRQPYEYNAMANIAYQKVVEYNPSGDYNMPRNEYDVLENKDLSGSSEEDLFLYDKKDVNLAVGARAYYHIFSDEVEYKHFYEWEIPVQNYNEKNKTDQVWHTIKLTNSTNYPWTTAPAFVMSGSKPLAQNTIEYTPKGGKVNLKLTQATDVKVNKKEFEAERERNVKLNSRFYDLIQVKGELFVKNYKNTDIVIEIRKKLVGEVMEASHKGKVTKTVEDLRSENFNSNILWEIPVKANEEINITYKYKMYQSN